MNKEKLIEYDKNRKNNANRIKWIEENRERLNSLNLLMYYEKREERLAKQKEYYERNRDKINRIKREKYNAEKEKIRKLGRKNEIRNTQQQYYYGIKLEDKQQLFEQQDSKCYISGKEIKLISDIKNEIAHTDHYILGNKKIVRKLLHKNINNAIGYFDENVEIISKIIKYLLDIENQEKIKQIIESNKYLYNVTNSNWTKFQKQKHYKLKNKFKISLWDYIEISNLQNNKCPITEIINIIKRELNLVVDHCHKTGNIRGLIDHKINIGIGLMEENIGWLNKTIKYLEKYGNRNTNLNEK